MNKSYDFEEMCPYCDHVNEVELDTPEQMTTVCEECGQVILLCSNCDMTTNCGKCPHESKIKEHPDNL